MSKLTKILICLFMGVCFSAQISLAFLAPERAVDGASAVLYFFLFGYSFGAIPFGYILVRLTQGRDIRTFGSGNIGATNVLRVGSKPLAAGTLFLDAVKGLVAILSVSLIAGPWSLELDLTSTSLTSPYLPFTLTGMDLLLVTAMGAYLGHLFPFWLNFKGGKGVASAFGLFLILAWPVALVALAVWLLSVIFFRISSLAALLATGITPVASYFFSSPKMAGFALLLSCLTFWTHRENIARLLKGKEPKIGQ